MLGLVRGFGLAVTLLLGSTGASAQFEEEPLYAEEDPELGEVSSTPASIPGPLTVYGGVRLGLGGVADYDPGGEDDLIATFGLQAGADYVLMPYFALGGELRIASFGTDYRDDRDNGRSLLFDIVVRPRARYVFDGMPLEIYGTLPLGLTVPSINDDWNANGKAGITFGIGLGANYFVSDKLGFGGEMTYLKHWISVDSNVVSGSIPADVGIALGQLYFVGNVIYAL